MCPDRPDARVDSVSDQKTREIYHAVAEEKASVSMLVKVHQRNAQ